MSKSQLKRFQKNNGTFLGRAHSVETRAKMSQKASRPKSDKWRESASKNRKGRQAHNKGILHSEETKQKIRESVKGEKNGFYGKHHSAEQREKKRQEKLTSPRHTCPHCSKIVDAMNYARWHGNNCKKRII